MSSFRCAAQRIIVTALAASLVMPGTALATVSVDDTELASGENSVGGGVATYLDSILDMIGVTAGYVRTDEDLTINFDGGNEVDHVQVTDDSDVTINFSGDNEVEDIESYDSSTVTVNMDDHNDFEDLEAHDQSSLTARVTGETECEAIKGYDDASVKVIGTTCPRKDIVEVGEGEASERIGTERGDLLIKGVTVVMESEKAQVISQSGKVEIKCAKISGGDDNERTDLHAGNTMFVGGSVIDVIGNMSSDGQMTIRRSDVDMEKPDGEASPYRVWSKTGITLIEEKNGEVKQGTLDGAKIYYVDTDDGDEVHLKSALTPCYYGSCGEDEKLPSTGSAAKTLPKTGDGMAARMVLPLSMLGSLCIALGINTKLRSRRAR